MVKAKGKKPAAEKKKAPAPGKATKKQNEELSDDELQQVSGGMSFGVPVLSQKVIGNEKWIDAVGIGTGIGEAGKVWSRGPTRGGSE